ncbi:MAG: gliding motility-associated C-terminal domain-containing protein [Bacteroidota bacterium]
MFGRFYSVFLKTTLVGCLLVYLNGSVQAQVFEIDENFFIANCGGVLVDDGGINGDHGPTDVQQITVCSNSPNADETHVRLSFLEWEVIGTIEIYNSDFPDPDALIYTGDGGVPNGPVVEASAANPGGCLTVVFTPAGSAPGFSANIECVRACQRVRSAIASSTPEIMPADTGYIDVCLGDPIVLTGTGEYPENGFAYNQDDATSTFRWNMEDGTILTGPNISHVYEEPGGYIIQLEITDVAGCENSNLISQRVRVADIPSFPIQNDIPTVICANDTLTLTASTEFDPNDSTSIFSFAEEQFFSQPATVADSFYLPDGSGVEYSSFIEFSSFPFGSTVTSPDDVVSFCVNMEHSYAGDLQIEMSCPNGTTVILHDFGALGGNYVGEPIDNDDTPLPGIGYDYCWNAGAARTWEETVDDLNLGFGDSIPAGEYAPVGDFADFVGCPLNGEWTLRVIDNLSIDNGFVFSWSTELAAYLFPERESFRIPVVSGRWVEEDNLDFYREDSISSIPAFAGESGYTFEVTDVLGCVNDTTITVDVLPYSSPDCYQCQPLLDSTFQTVTSCPGAENQTSLGSRQTLDTVIAWADYPLTDFSVETHPNEANTLRSTISVNSMRPNLISNVFSQIQSVCVNVETRFTDEVTMILQAPNGAQLLLVENRGVTNDFTNTCFTPDAALPIAAGTNPFTGEFLPEGNWEDLNGTQINGDWILIAWDRFGVNSPGRFINWSIEFTHDNPIAYTWAPTEGLSCTTCPNPIITSDVAQTYTVTATDSYGCTEVGTVEYTLAPFSFSVTSEETDVSCVGSNDGSIEISTSEPAPVNYEWSNMATTQDIFNLAPGDYQLTITEIGTGCQNSFSYTIDEPDTINISLVSVDSASCAGASDGAIDIDISGGTGDFTYAWDDPNLLQILQDAVSLQAGTYTVTATDENNCIQTFSATVEEPLPVSVSFDSQDITCRGQNNGSAQVIATGGNGDFSYNWQTNAMTDTAMGLTAGDFSVTVTDRNGCSEIGTVTINEPATALVLSASQDASGCAGDSLNTATALALGGIGPYEYAWANGSTSATASNLPSGQNTVTITDSGGCIDSITVNLNDLEPITFNLIDSRPACSGTLDGEMGFNQLAGGAPTPPDGYTYEWSNGQTTVVATNLVGNVEYFLTITDSQGCSGVASRLLLDPAPITALASATPAACFGASSGSVSIANIVSPNPGDVDIQWDPSAGNSTSATVDNLPAGTYTVVITDAQGCTLAEEVTITQPDQLNANFVLNNVTCFGDTDGAIFTTVSGGIPGYTYNWSNTSTEANLSQLPAGQYDLLITDGNGCELNESITIEQPGEVVATATSDPAVCFGDATGQVNIVASGGREPFTYSVDNSGFTRGETFIGLPAGTYTAFVRDAGGCIGTTQVTVNDGPEFTLDLGEDQTIDFGDSIRLTPSYTGAVDSISFFWRGSYDGTLICRGTDEDRLASTVVTCEFPNAKPEFEIDYTLLMVDGNGCEAEDRIRISVQKFRIVEVPTGFTPNGDGVNDLLVVHGRPGTTVKTFRVFDRWGELLYEDENYDVNELGRGWNGEFRDQPVPSGAYVWQAFIVYEDGSEEIRSGETNLIR